MKSVGYTILLYGVTTMLLLVLLAFTAISIDSEGYQSYHGILFGTIGCQIAIHITFMVWYSLKDCIKGYLIFTTAELVSAVVTTLCSLMLLLWSTNVYDGGFGIFPFIIFVVGLLLVFCNIILVIIKIIDSCKITANNLETKLDEIQSLLDSKKITKEEYDKIRTKMLDSF